MDRIDWTFRALQAVNVLILAAWLLPVLLALIRLRRCQLAPVARVLWVMVVVLVPLVGALAFLIVRPGHARPDENEGG
jgi:hypothetical protein